VRRQAAGLAYGAAAAAAHEHLGVVALDILSQMPESRVYLYVPAKKVPKEVTGQLAEFCQSMDPLLTRDLAPQPGFEPGTDRLETDHDQQ
jgi:hypothetical protein